MFAGHRGEARIWQWAKNIFFTFGNVHVAQRRAVHSKVIAFVMGDRGHAPTIIFL